MLFRSEKQEKTTWVNIVIFGKLAEIAGQYLNKGSKVFISGKLQVRKWQNTSGEDKYTTEIVIDSFNGTMQMLDGKPAETVNGPGPARQPAPRQAPQAQKQTHDQVVDEASQGFDALDDSIPFIQFERFML